MRRFFLSLLSLAMVALTLQLSSCTKTTDPSEPQIEKGLYSVKEPCAEINNIGGEVSVSFLALGDWSVTSDAEWCSPITSDGAKGDATLRIKVLPNPDDTARTATIYISIDGYQSDQTLCEVMQTLDADSGDEPTGLDVNKWISKYLETSYLWNDEFIKIKEDLDYRKDADTFLQSALTKMEGNDEDGKYYASGERYYYTFLTTYGYAQGAPATRAENMIYGYGIDMLYPAYSQENKNAFYLQVASVVPNSPAYYAGIKRGMIITRYNGSEIIGGLLDESYYILMGNTYSTDMLQLELKEYQPNSYGGYSLTTLDPVNLSPSYYTADPIIYKSLYKNPDNQAQVVGHMVYAEFNMGADELLIDALTQFKDANITDLILDLRYNGGGDVYSSTVLASAIAGPAYKGQTYCHMEYNAYRTARGEEGFFYIGENPSIATYPQIEEAMAVALNLKRIYVIGTGFTASASELVINGLRGLDIEVVLVGQRTEGKNVGMEVIKSKSLQYSDYDFGSFEYEFAPITFYNRNAKGFKDFNAGFEPDFEFNESTEVLLDWDQGADMCVNASLHHIFNGEWPTSKASTRGVNQLEICTNSHLRPMAKGCRVYKNLNTK